MTMPAELTLLNNADIDRNIARLRNATSQSSLRTKLYQIMKSVGIMAEGFVRDYPKASGKPLAKVYTRSRKDGSTYLSKFKTLRQEHWFWWALRTGILVIPYRRAGALGGSITSEANAVSSGMGAYATIEAVATVGTNLAYAPYVLDETLQSHYFEGTWTPLQTAVANHLEQIAAFIVDELAADIQQMIA